MFSPNTPDPLSGSSSSSPPEPEPALNRSPNVFSGPAIPSRQLLLSAPHSPGAVLSLSPRARFAAGAPAVPNKLWVPPVAYIAKGFDRAPVPGPGEPERRTGDRARAAADTSGDAADANASKPVRLAGVGLAARWTGELGTVLGGEPSVEGAVVKMGVVFELGVDVMVVVVVVELLVVPEGAEEAPKILGPLTAANGELTAAYARKPPPPCVRVSSSKPNKSEDEWLTKTDADLILGEVGALGVCTSDPFFFFAGRFFLSVSFSGGGDARFGSRGLGSTSPSSSRGRLDAPSTSECGGVDCLVTFVLESELASSPVSSLLGELSRSRGGVAAG